MSKVGEVAELITSGPAAKTTAAIRKHSSVYVHSRTRLPAAG